MASSRWSPPALAFSALLVSPLFGCATGAGNIETAIEEYAPGNSTLTYKNDGNFQFDWKTPSSYGNTCRVMYVAFSDGNKSPLAYFKFK